MTVFEQAIRFGVGKGARREATKLADELWQEGRRARAMFKPDLGGWVVIVYRPRTDGPALPRPGPR